MKNKFSDSNKPSSEIPQDESRGNSESSNSGVILPARRTVADRANDDDVEKDSRVGLRIEPEVMRQSITNSSQQLEVRELNGSTLRLDNASCKPKKPAKLQIFKERERRVRGEAHQKSEVNHWGARPKQSMRWMLYGGVAVGALIILSIVLLPLFNSLNAPQQSLNEVLLKVDVPVPVQDDELEIANFMTTQEDEATRLYHSYLLASHVDEVIPLIRDGAALTEILHSHWQPLEKSNTWRPEWVTAWGVFGLQGKSYGKLEGTLPDQSKFTAYFAKDGERILIDWKATVAFSTATFDDLDKGVGDTREIRGNLAVADFYTTQWPESIYQSCKLISPDNDFSIWCYFRREDLMGKSISQILPKYSTLSGNLPFNPVTVRLKRGPTDTARNQWEIAEMIHIDWITPHVKP